MEDIMNDAQYERELNRRDQNWERDYYGMAGYDEDDIDEDEEDEEEDWDE
jgi:hypothetical protein